MKFNFFKPSKPFAFSRGLVVAFCCILLCSSANAQLTQAEMTQALLDAFDAYGVLKNGQDAIPSWPIDNAGRQLARYLSTGTDVVSGSVAYWQKHMYDDLLPLLRSIILATSSQTFSVSNQLDQISSTLGTSQDGWEGLFPLLVHLYEEVHDGLDPTVGDGFANSVIYALLDNEYSTPYLAKIRNLTYTEGRELRVHDEDSNWHLQSIALDADSILDELRTFNHDPAPEIVSNLTETAEQITDGISDEIAEYWDEDPSSTISEAESDAEDETEESVSDFDEAIEGYDPSIETPDTNSSYTDTDLADPDLNGLAPDLNHGRTILLTPGFAFNPAIDFPRMEVDPLRDSNFSAFFDSITSTVRHVWQALFVMGCIWIVRFRYRQIRMLLLSVTAPGFDSVASKAELEVTKANDASHAGAGADVTLI